MKSYYIARGLLSILSVVGAVYGSDHKDSDTYSQSSQSSRLSEEARLIGLQRVTDELYSTPISARSTPPPQRHHSFDQTHDMDPPPRLHLGDSFASLPDMLENTGSRSRDELFDNSDWLTPRAERQLQDLFPNVVSYFSSESSNAGERPRQTSQGSPRAQTPNVSSESSLSFQTPLSSMSRSNTPQQPSYTRFSSSTQRHASRRRRHVCPHCLLSFDRRDHLDRHTGDHETDERERQVIQCPVCRSAFMGRTALINLHIPTHYQWDKAHQEIRLV